MPIHDWTRVNAGLFHHFHHGWTAALSSALNTGGLPPGYYALSEQVVGKPVADVLTLQKSKPSKPKPQMGIGLATPPKATFVCKADLDPYVTKANRIAVRHPLGHVVAIIEIVSPGNKESKHALRAFVDKAVDLLRQGIHLLVVDLFPPSKRDPAGIYKAIWDEIRDVLFELPPGKPLTVSSYDASSPIVAYVEPLAVGDVLPSMPLFLEPDVHVPVPLESTYMTTWNLCPDPLKEAVETPPA